MVQISVIDTADNAGESYSMQTFTMLTEGASAELAALNIDCSTGDDDGIAEAYERFIGTDCKRFCR